MNGHSLERVCHRDGAEMALPTLACHRRNEHKQQAVEAPE